MNQVIRRIRGTIGNALTWGSVWFGATFLFATSVEVIFGRFNFMSILLGSSVLGAVGALTGGAFSAYLAANFRRQRIDDLSPVGVAVGGGLVAALVTLVFIIAVTTVENSGWPLLLGDLAFPLGFSTILGGITGYSSVKLAQSALPHASRPELGVGESGVVH